MQLFKELYNTIKSNSFLRVFVLIGIVCALFLGLYNFGKIVGAIIASL